MTSGERECNKCDRTMSKGVLFYKSKEDGEYDLCKRCYDKKLNKGKISEDEFQLTVYCLPSGIYDVIIFIVNYTFPIYLSYIVS